MAFVAKVPNRPSTRDLYCCTSIASRDARSSSPGNVSWMNASRPSICVQNSSVCGPYDFEMLPALERQWYTGVSASTETTRA